MTDSEFIEALQERVEELEQGRTDYYRTLQAAAQRLQEIGLIDPTPHARFLFVSGEREL